METSLYDSIKPVKKKYLLYVVILFLVSSFLGLILLIVGNTLNSASKTFPVETLVEVPSGFSVFEIATLLQNKNFIRSDLLFTVIVKIYKYDTFLQAGEYIFPVPLSTKELVSALISGEYEKPPLTIQFIEGTTGVEIVEVLEEKISSYNTSGSLSYFDESIGYLFPDTYFVKENITNEELVAIMKKNYERKTSSLDMASSKFTEEEIIILASIVEKEANDEESMRRVAGILIERLNIGMALQVDATFKYILDKTSAELTLEDLKTDSPFNTYTNRGLPPTPIANPGLTAIKAVLNPIVTNDLYFLTSIDGTFYYAETFYIHKQNKTRYLR